MKRYIILGGAVAVVLVGIALGLIVLKTSPGSVLDEDTTPEAIQDSGAYPEKNEEHGSVGTEETPADMFTGTLEQVDTGCFADGECFVTVDGKHVTAIMGWSQEKVGTIVGVEGFGDLTSHIGEEVEVYAGRKEDGTYTLYGNEGFYIKLVEVQGEFETGVSGDGESEPDISGGGCVVGGCSGQLCIDANEGGGMSTCEYRSEYACYKTATCRRLEDGQCGWVETKELLACLAQKAGESIEDAQ